LKILVTGGAGFIGSHFADHLIKAGHSVVVIDNLSSGTTLNLPPEAEFIEIDIRHDKLDEVFRKHQFDAIYHLAAQMDVRYSVKYPLEDLDINIGGSVRLLELCRKFGVKKFVFASTGGAIYGEQDVFPAPESHPMRPISPYGVSKLSVERYMYFYHNEYQINGTVLRFANVFGPRQNPHGEAGVVAIFCSRLLSGEQAFVNGDGLQTRDYVFVRDVARMAVMALPLEGFQTFNIGTGIETDVVTLFDRLNELTGGKMKRLHKDALAGEQRRSSIDSSYATTTLGWKPEVNLVEGLDQTVDFFKRRLVDKNWR